MRLFEIHRTANVAWSPVDHNKAGAMLAAGTSAQQVDADFRYLWKLSHFVNNCSIKLFEQHRGYPGCISSHSFRKQFGSSPLWLDFLRSKNLQTCLDPSASNRATDVPCWGFDRWDREWHHRVFGRCCAEQ